MSDEKTDTSVEDTQSPAPVSGLTVEQHQAGYAAALAAIEAAGIPGWERSMIPDEAIQSIVDTVGIAVLNAHSAPLAVNLPHTPPAMPGQPTAEEYMALTQPPKSEIET